MGFESYRQGAFTRRLADLPDQPNMQAAELKTYFDSSPEELRQALNRLCDALGEFSAAAKLGYTASAGVPAQTVQDAIDVYKRQHFRLPASVCCTADLQHHLRSDRCSA